MVPTAANITPRVVPTIIMKVPHCTHRFPKKKKSITPVERW